VASGAKNHRFRGGSAGDPSTDPVVGSDRRERRDRRDPNQADLYGGVDRRRGPRREGDLPTPVWRRPLGLAVAIGLGIAGGLALDSLQAKRSAEAAPIAAVRERELDPEALSRVQALRDEAQALTAAEVALDERAHERWLPRVAKIDEALDDPATPDRIRTELQATIAALECVGVLEHDDDGSTCVTLER
jgi:hypothetical protein